MRGGHAPRPLSTTADAPTVWGCTRSAECWRSASQGSGYSQTPVHCTAAQSKGCRLGSQQPGSSTGSSDRARQVDTRDMTCAVVRPGLANGLCSHDQPPRFGWGPAKSVLSSSLKNSRKKLCSAAPIRESLMDLAALVSVVADSSAARRSAYLVNASKRCCDGVMTSTPALMPPAPRSAASLAAHALCAPHVSGEKVSPGNVANSSTLRRKTTSGSNRITLRNLVCALRTRAQGSSVSSC